MSEYLKINIVLDDLVYEFEYVNGSDMLKILCKHCCGYVWLTTIQYNFITDNQMDDNIYLTPLKIYELLNKYKNGTLPDIYTIKFQNYIKGLNKFGYFDNPEDYYLANIILEIIHYNNHRKYLHIITLESDKTITVDIINKIKLYCISSKIYELDIDNDKIQNTLEYIEKNTDDVKNIIYGTTQKLEKEITVLNTKLEDLVNKNIELNKQYIDLKTLTTNLDSELKATTKKNKLLEKKVRSLHKRNILKKKYIM